MIVDTGGANDLRAVELVDLDDGLCDDGAMHVDSVGLSSKAFTRSR